MRECGYTLNSEEKLNFHVRMAQFWKCVMCDFITDTGIELERHTEEQHGNNEICWITLKTKINWAHL